MNVAHINRIISTTEKVNVDSIETYSNDYQAADFGDDDQINKQAVVELIADAISGAALPPIPLSYPAGTSLPITIATFNVTYAVYGTYPTIMILNATTGDEITNPTVNRSPVTSPVTVTINAADDGTGITDSDIIIVIKQ